MSKLYTVPTDKAVLTDYAELVLGLLVKGVPIASAKLRALYTDAGHGKAPTVWTDLFGAAKAETRAKWTGATASSGYVRTYEGYPTAKGPKGDYSCVGQGLVTISQSGRSFAYTLTDKGAKILANTAKVKAARKAAEKTAKAETVKTS